MTEQEVQVSLAGHYLEESLCVYLRLADDGSRWVLDGPVNGYSQYEQGPEWRECECGADDDTHRAAANAAERLPLPDSAMLRQLLDEQMDAPPAPPRSTDTGGPVKLGPALNALDPYDGQWDPTGEHRESVIADLIADLLHVAADLTGARGGTALALADVLVDRARRNYDGEITGDNVSESVDSRGYDRERSTGDTHHMNA